MVSSPPSPISSPHHWHSLTLISSSNLLHVHPVFPTSITSSKCGTHATKVRRWVARGRAAHAAFLGVRWLSTDVVEAVVRVHGGVKFYRGAAEAARAYVERDRSRADDYYLGRGHRRRRRGSPPPRTASSDARRRWTATTYEQWVAGIDVDTGAAEGSAARGRERAAVRRGHRQRAEDLVAGRRAAPGDLGGARRGAGPGRRARSSAGSPQHATTRVGPRGRQVQVPVEQIEAAVIRHYTSRAGDPHRHLHLQINARVFAAGAWRGLHSVGVRDSHRGDQRHRARRGR